MTLLDAVTAAKTKTSTKGSKGPGDYNRERNAMIKALVSHQDPIVRAAALSHPCCPATYINSALVEEQDKDVLRAILMGVRVSNKALSEFALSDRGALFDDDEDVQRHIIARIGAGFESDSTEPVGGPNSSTSDEDESEESEEELEADTL